MRAYIDTNADFKCVHCHGHITADTLFAGVNNRNHCPYCLWSRHMDWFKAGDRLSACKAPMRPIGLTLKQRRKKYASVAGGELMLIHQCIDCGQLSINRIAADDVPEVILEVFDASAALSSQVQDQIQISGINLLGRTQADSVCRQLYGALSPTVAKILPDWA